MKWLKNKLKKWLVDDEIKTLEKKMDNWSIKLHRENEESKRLYQESKDRFEQIVDIGVDVHERSDSWAVVCINGKQSYVKFQRFSQREIREVSSFLRRYEQSNKVIDTPMGFPEDWWLKW